MKKKVNWGILSTADIAQKQLIPAFQRSKNADVVAIASGSGLEKAKAVGQQFSIDKIYESYERILDDPDIDAVYIPLPNHLHKQWVIAAATKGKHILCEKPAALNAAEVKEMREACEENNVNFMEAFMYYFHPQHARVMEIIDSGEIGDVSYMQAGFAFNIGDNKEENVRMSDQKGGGSIYDIGCYAIHSIRNILRAEPNTVQVHVVKDPNYNVDTEAVGYLTFANGLRASFDTSFQLANRAEYEVLGSQGRIVIPRAYRPDWNGGEGLVIVEKEGVTRTETIHADQYRNQVEHFSQVILNSASKLGHDMDNTLGNMRVIDACLESAIVGKRVKLD